MTNVSEWSVTAGLNNSSPPDGWPENMARSAVNDCAREMMAALARWYKTSHGSLTTAGTGNAYTLTTGASYASNADLPILSFVIDRANTSAITLAVDGNTALPVYRSSVNHGNFFAGEWSDEQLGVVAYNPGGWFDYLGSTVDGFQAFTLMVFQQTSAPTFWVKQSTHNNKSIRVTSTTVGSGGSTPFTSIFTSRTVALANLPVTNLSLATLTGSVNTGITVTNGGSRATGAVNTLQQGTGSSYTGLTSASLGTVTAALNDGTVSFGGSIPLGGSGTAMDFDVQYVDVIIARRG